MYGWGKHPLPEPLPPEIVQQLYDSDRDFIDGFRTSTLPIVVRAHNDAIEHMNLSPNVRDTDQKEFVSVSQINRWSIEDVKDKSKREADRLAGLTGYLRDLLKRLGDYPQF